MEFLGIKLIGVNSGTGKKVLFSLVLIFGLWIATSVARAIAGSLLKGHPNIRTRFLCTR